MATAPQFDRIILNDDLEKALKEAEALVAEHIAKNPTEDSHERA